MKKILLTLLVLSFAGLIFAQEDEKMQTLIKAPSKIRGYVGPLMNFTNIDGEFAYMSGFTASGIFNDKILFGFYSQVLETPMYSKNDDYLGADMNFDHQGISIGYIFMPKKMLHFTTILYAGKGNLEVYNDLTEKWIDDNIIFNLNPMIEAEINLFRFLRVGVGVNYNFAFDVDQINGYTDQDFSGFGGNLSLKFGWFK
ncbi:MAG: hypothetical protein A2W99_17525 [Bacteroidetes bacterium GWF2_33_16]|nr:MAG: hypothetical protein A2X00_14665 [Bacteroidetes bacterium GWE2_32_14]OFY06837.1 MAG: hypothetical protein A2W99_17525 [Bacteroidetes bacterium GWF2_33_16]